MKPIAKSHFSNYGKPWSKKENQFLRKHYRKMSATKVDLRDIEKWRMRKMIYTVINTAFLMVMVYFHMLRIVCHKEEINRLYAEKLKAATEELKEVKELNKFFELSKGMPKI